MSSDLAISYRLEAPKKTSSPCSNNFFGPIFVSSIHIFKAILQILIVPISALFWMALIIWSLLTPLNSRVCRFFGDGAKGND